MNLWHGVMNTEGTQQCSHKTHEGTGVVKLWVVLELPEIQFYNMKGPNSYLYQYMTTIK